MYDGLKLGNEVKAEMYEVRRDKTKASQSAGLSGTMDIEHRRNRGITAGATAGKPQKHQAVQSAVPDVDGLELGNEVKAEIHDVRRDRTEVNQSGSLSGTIEVEHQAAGQVAGSQTRPKSLVPAVASLDADRAVKTAEKEAALAGVKAAGLSGTVEIECLRYAADQAAGIQARPRSPTPTATGLDADSAVMRVPESSACGTPCLYEETNLAHTVKVSNDMRIGRSAGTWADLVGTESEDMDGKEKRADGQSTAAESASNGENESPAADSEREDSWLTQRMWTAVDSRGPHGPVHSTSAIRIIADAWADLASNDEDAKAQQLLKTAMEHPGVDKETLREALLDSVRKMVEEVRVEPSPMTAGKEVLSDLAAKPASKKGKTGSSKKKPKP